MTYSHKTKVSKQPGPFGLVTLGVGSADVDKAERLLWGRPSDLGESLETGDGVVIGDPADLFPGYSSGLVWSDSDAPVLYYSNSY